MKSHLAARLRLWTYDAAFCRRFFPRGTYVFTDIDRLGYADLELASRLYLQLRDAGARVLNNPATLRKRYALLRALYRSGLNSFNAYTADELPETMRFPVFVRRPQGHGGPLSGLLNSRAEVVEAIDRATASGFPRENLIVIEYAAEPIQGVFRKLSAFKMGSEIIPHISGHDTNWLVKAGQQGIAPAKLYELELELIRSNPFASHLRQVFEIAGIDYGRADFGLVEGQVQVYEINTNPHVFAPYPHPNETRVRTLKLVWEMFLAGLEAIDTPGEGRLVFKTRDYKLRKHQGRRGWFIRTRKAE
jgi:hypothetical protein